MRRSVGAREWQDTGSNIPLALTTTEVVLDIVGCVAGCGTALAVLGLLEVGAEDFVVRVVANLVDDDVLLVVGDLVDDVLDLALAQTELVELVDTLILHRDTIGQISINSKRRGRGRGGVVPRCELRRCMSVTDEVFSRGLVWETLTDMIAFVDERQEKGE